MVVHINRRICKSINIEQFKVVTYNEPCRFALETLQKYNRSLHFLKSFSLWSIFQKLFKLTLGLHSHQKVSIKPLFTNHWSKYIRKCNIVVDVYRQRVANTAQNRNYKSHQSSFLESIKQVNKNRWQNEEMCINIEIPSLIQALKRKRPRELAHINIMSIVFN